MKANWSCTACGMYSGRRYCVQRHINNNNIHKGNANAIPFVEYLVGRRERSYPPAGRPPFGSQKQRILMEKTEDELENMFARRAAESFSPSVGDRAYLPVITQLLNDIKNRRYRSDWEEFFEILEFLQRNRKPNVETTQGTTTKGAAQHERMHDYDLEGYNKILEFLQRNRKPNVKSMNTRI